MCLSGLTLLHTPEGYSCCLQPKGPPSTPPPPPKQEPKGVNAKV